jgi:hypothetical protein
LSNEVSFTVRDARSYQFEGVVIDGGDGRVQCVQENTLAIVDSRMSGEEGVNFING